MWAVTLLVLLYGSLRRAPASLLSLATGLITQLWEPHNFFSLSIFESVLNSWATLTNLQMNGSHLEEVFPTGTFDNIWKRWLSYLGEGGRMVCSCHLVGGGQGGCYTSYSARSSLHHKELPGLKGKVEKLYLRPFSWQCLISDSFPQSCPPQGAWHGQQPCGTSASDLWAACRHNRHWCCPAGFSCEPLCGWHVGMVARYWETLSKFVSFVRISDSV